MIGRGVGIMERKSMSRIGIMSKRKNGHNRSARKKNREVGMTRGDMIKDDFINSFNSNLFINRDIYHFNAIKNIFKSF